MKKLLCSILMLTAYAHCSNTNLQPKMSSHLMIGSPMRPAGVDPATGIPYYIANGKKVYLPALQQPTSSSSQSQLPSQSQPL